ncbi:MAG TPA: IPT/TIG domain-containing protein [Acidimicrobiales bacterium]|nr:IPT/TIG domain-containing protein [Acidimicrobiales bacterium]
MSDIGTTLRRASQVYADSYPPDVLNLIDPHIASLVPSTVSAAAAATIVQVNGTNFEAGSVVEVNQVAQATTFVSATQLTISFDPAAAGPVQFTVRNPNEEESNSVTFTVTTLVADDVSAWTIDDVKGFVVEHPDLLAEVLAFEESGKRRAGLLAWLQALVDEEDPTTPIAEETS